MKTIFDNAGNAREFLSLVHEIERSRFKEVPSEWYCSCMLPIPSPGNPDSGADYRFYNPYTTRFISESESTFGFRGMDLRLQSFLPVIMNFIEVDDDLVGSNADLT